MEATPYSRSRFGNKTTSQSLVTDLAVTDVSTTTITVERNVTDDERIESYRIYRDSPSLYLLDEPALIGGSRSRSYTYADLAEETAYTYTVSAIDEDGNESPPSSDLTVTTSESTPEETTTENHIAAYYTRWSRDRDYYPEDVPFDKLTHLNCAFLDVRSDGTVTYSDSAVDRRNLEVFRDLK